MSKTIEEMKEAKRQLEQDILKCVREFEETYCVAVDRVELYKNSIIGSVGGITTGVKLEVKV